MTLVSNAKRDSTRSEKRLSRLEDRQEKVTKIVQQRRDEIASIKMELIGTRVGYSRTKDGKAAALTKVRQTALTSRTTLRACRRPPTGSPASSTAPSSRTATCRSGRDRAA